MNKTEIEVTEELIRLAKKHGRKNEMDGFISYLNELKEVRQELEPLPDGTAGRQESFPQPQEQMTCVPLN